MNQYLQGLFLLKKLLANEPDGLELFSALEGRLLANLHAARLTNTGQNVLAERSIILQGLDELTQHHCRQTFQELCVSEDETALVVTTEKTASPQAPSNLHAETATLWPTITYELSTRVIPVAYYMSSNSPEIPFITFQLDNSHLGCNDVHLSVSISIEGFSGESGREIKIARGEKASFALQPTWSGYAITNLDKPLLVNLHIDISSLHAPQEKRRLTEHIYLHAYNTAILAQINAHGRAIDLTYTLAGWVTPYRIEIEQLLSRAIEDYKQDHRFLGYHISGSPQKRAQGVYVQVKALFETLKRQATPHYVPSALTFAMDSQQIIQRVRLPSETLTSGGSANCLDGTVLFASLLELASLYPAIVIIPGHAFVAWKPLPEENDRYECLETTFIRDQHFESAVLHANQHLVEARQRQDFSRPLFDPNGFARLIDIAQCRARGITPLE